MTSAIGTAAAFLQDRLRLADPDMQDPKPQNVSNRVKSVATVIAGQVKHTRTTVEQPVAAMVAGLTTSHYEEVMAFMPHQMIVKQQY